MRFGPNPGAIAQAQRPPGPSVVPQGGPPPVGMQQAQQQQPRPPIQRQLYHGHDPQTKRKFETNQKLLIAYFLNTYLFTKLPIPNCN